MKLLGWFSRSGDVLVAMDPLAASQLKDWLQQAEGVPPIAQRLLSEVTQALREEREKRA